MANGGKVVVKIDGDTSGFKSAMGKLKGVAGTAAKAIGVGFTAAASAVGAIGAAAVKAQGEYEQLVGGIETLFGTGGQTVEEYAAKVGKSVSDAAADYEKLTSVQETMIDRAHSAFERAGVSANTYMETATSFAASLVSSLGGDTVKAADYADQAIVDMSDNANKMGTAIESIQWAYQGFAKQNYTMLDNLKLGYGGTQEEMKRLVRDAAAVDESINVNSLSFDNVVKAIHVVQEQMGITGTTAKEAATTIQGSLGMTKAAWENLMVALANPDVDLDGALDDLINSAKTFASNLLPVVKQVLSTLPTAISELGVEIANGIPSLVAEILPALVDGAAELINAVVATLPELIDAIIDTIPDVINGLEKVIDAMLNEFSQNSKKFAQQGAKLALTLANAIIRNIPKFVKAGKDIIIGVYQGINSELPILSNVGKMIAAVFAAIKINSLVTSVVSGFRTITAAVKGYEAAMVAMQTVNAFGASGSIFLASTLKPLELLYGVLTGKIALNTAATVLWTTAQTALNTVMNLNPIFLLISGLALLAVGIYAAMDAYTGYIEKNSELVLETGKMVEASQAAIDKTNELSNSLNSLGEQGAARITDLEAEAYANEMLTDELYSLAGQSSLTADEKARMKNIVDQLNGSIDGLNLVLDEETGQLNLTEDAVKDLITQKLELAKTNAVAELYTEQLKEQYKAQTEATTTAKKLADAQAKLDEITAQATQSGQGLIFENVEQREAYNNLKEAIKNYKQALNNCESAVQNSFDNMESLSEVAGVQLPDSFNTAKEKSDGFFDGLKESTGTMAFEGEKGGLWFGGGYARGISSQKTAVYSAAYDLARTALQGTKDGQRSASPSKETRKLGRYYGLGYALGMKDEVAEVTDIAKLLAVSALKKTSSVLKSNVNTLINPIKNMLTDTRSEVQKARDEIYAPLLESEKRYQDESARIEIEQKEFQKRIDDEKNSDRQKALRDELEIKKEADKKYLDTLNAAAKNERKIYTALQKDIENSQKSILNSIEELSKNALSSIEEVEKLQSTMQKKLSDYGDLYTKQTKERYGKTFEVISLADLSKQTDALDNYADMLLRIKERGNVPQEFFAMLRDMSVEEGMKYAEALLNADDVAFNKYIDDWKAKQATAENLSKILYADEAEEVKSEIAEAFDKFDTDLDQQGRQNAAAWGNGFYEKVKSIIPSILDEINSAFGNIIGIPTYAIAGNSSGGTIDLNKLKGSNNPIVVNSVIELDGREVGRSVGGSVGKENNRRGSNFLIK